MERLQDFIFIANDVVPTELRTKILQEYVKSDDWQPGAMGLKHETRKEIRNVDEIHVSESTIIEKNNATRKEIDTALFTCASLALTKYLENYKNFTQIQILNDEGYTLLRYQESQFYVEHIDASSSYKFRRVLSCSFAVNDEYEGGEWSFFGGAYTQRLNAGDAIIFPSNFLFPHSILPITSGVRYSVVTWFG